MAPAEKCARITTPSAERAASPLRCSNLLWTGALRRRRDAASMNELRKRPSPRWASVATPDIQAEMKVELSKPLCQAAS